MKSIAVLLLIGAINIEDVAAVSHHHHHRSEYAQLANLMANKQQKAEINDKTAHISNKEHNEYQEYFENHPISAADTKMAWNEGMLHHTSSDYADDAPAGYTFSQQQSMDDPCTGLGCANMNKHGKTEKFKMNYPVPDFGADPDIETTKKSISIAEDVTGKQLIMGTPESRLQWKNPAKDTKYDYNPKLDGDVVAT
jgi:hypothetical protein|tara:strand:- start:12 stop:599 length:588 start_codon:yes stop_codon:yes gene_type:complete